MVFRPGDPKPPGSGRRKGQVPRDYADLRERIESAMGGRPLPLILAEIAQEARQQGDLAVAVKAADCAAKYAYAIPAPIPAPVETQTTREPRILVIEPGTP